MPVAEPKRSPRSSPLIYAAPPCMREAACTPMQAGQPVLLTLANLSPEESLVRFALQHF